MEQIELRAESRDVFGKKTKRLRRSGLIPATLYGPRTEPVSLQVRERDLRSVLDRAGMHQLISLWIDQADIHFIAENFIYRLLDIWIKVHWVN